MKLFDNLFKAKTKSEESDDSLVGTVKWDSNGGLSGVIVQEQIEPVGIIESGTSWDMNMSEDIPEGTWVKTSHGKTGQVVRKAAETTYIVKLSTKEVEIDVANFSVVPAISMRIVNGHRPFVIAAEDVPQLLAILKKNAVVYKLT